jgi:hypothetical protein
LQRLENELKKEEEKGNRHRPLPSDPEYQTHVTEYTEGQLKVLLVALLSQAEIRIRLFALQKTLSKNAQMVGCLVCLITSHVLMAQWMPTAQYE